MTGKAFLYENLPLTETTFFILLSLSMEPRHGYAIMKDVQSLSEGRVILSTGTLYGALKRLLEQGWIERTKTPAISEETVRPRKAYALTKLGQRVFEAETNRLEALAAVARLRTTGAQA